MRIPPGWDGAQRQVVWEVENLLKLRDQLDRLSAFGLPSGSEDEKRADLQMLIKKSQTDLQATLDTLVSFPPRLGRHFELLEEFWKGGTYETSVFIMCKFPDQEDAARDAELERVIEAVADAIGDQGFVPRVARFPSEFHAGLWDNVELHLLGCKHGVAIVEDRHRDELNPNVAMEWGWMRAMGRKVYFLREAKFANFRADLGDLLSAPFIWDDPEPGVRAAITGWLKNGS